MSVAPKAASAVTFREARFDDYKQVAAIQARRGLAPKSFEEWQHLWVNNPLYKKLAAWHLGWVAENEDGEIVGYAGHIPLSYEFRGREIIAAAAHGLSIDRLYRGKGVYLLRRHVMDELTDVVLTSNTNPNSARLCDAMCSRVPTGNWSQAAFWIVNYRKFLDSALGKKGWPKWLSLPASAALVARDRLTTTGTWMLRDGRSKVENCEGFDERFDRFWEKLREANPNKFLATRSREVLQWHFQYSLARNRVWVVTAEDNSGMTGYAIFCRKDLPAIGLTRARLIDFQVLNDNVEMLIPMLSRAFRRCQDEGVHMLEAFGFAPAKQRVIESLKPYHRQFAAWIYFYRARDRALAKELEDGAVWDPCQFDGDSTL